MEVCYRGLTQPKRKQYEKIKNSTLNTHALFGAPHTKNNILKRKKVKKKKGHDPTFHKGMKKKKDKRSHIKP